MESLVKIGIHQVVLVLLFWGGKLGKLAAEASNILRPVYPLVFCNSHININSSSPSTFKLIYHSVLLYAKRKLS